MIWLKRVSLFQAVLVVFLLAFTSNAVAQLEIDIDADPDYRYRDIFGSQIEDLDGLLEVYRGGNWHTRTALEFPLAAAADCGFIADVQLTVWGDDSLPGVFNPQDVEVYGFVGDGTPALENVLSLDIWLNSFYPVISGPMNISIPNDFIQALLDNDDPYAGFILASDIEGVDVLFLDGESGQPAQLSIDCLEQAPIGVPALSGWLKALLVCLLLAGAIATIRYRQSPA